VVDRTLGNPTDGGRHVGAPAKLECQDGSTTFQHVHEDENWIGRQN
jgi:hypothetical protein